MEELTSVHCPLVWTMSMTQGSDLFNVSRSSRALHDTRSSTLETQAAGPLRLVAGELASWSSFILAQAGGSVQSAKTERCEAAGGSWVEGSWQGHGALTGPDLEHMSQKEQRCPMTPQQDRRCHYSWLRVTPNCEEHHLTSLIKINRA